MFNFVVGVLVGAVVTVTVPYVFSSVSKWIVKAQARFQ